MIKERESLQCIFEPDELVELLCIVDLALPNVVATLQEQVNSTWLEKLGLSLWKLESAYKEYIHCIVSSSANPHLLLIVSREHVMDRKAFDI